MTSDDTKLADYPLDSNGNIPDDFQNPSDSIIGSLIADRYRIEKLIGEGGMGHVYQATHVLMGKKMAIKLIHSKLAHVDEIAQRFEIEARSSSKLSSPHCISVIDFGKTDNNQLFLAMELLEGEELDQRLKRQGKLEVQEALKITSQMLKGLIHAHEKGIIHRDIKPENIFLVNQGATTDFVKILDFGIAKMTAEPGALKLTKTGMVFGTPKYLSPEQALGDKIDHRTDLYSAGVILFEILTGKPAFEADTAMDTLSLHLTAPIPKLSDHGDYPKELQKIINRAMAKKPDDRFKDAHEFLEAIDSVDISDNTEITIVFPNIVPGPKSIKKMKKSILKSVWTSKTQKIVTVSALSIILLIIFYGIMHLRPEPAVHNQNRPQSVIAENSKNVNTGNLKTHAEKELQQLIDNTKEQIKNSNYDEAAVMARKAMTMGAVSKKLANEARVLLGNALFAAGKKTGAVFQYQAAIEKDTGLSQDVQLLENIRAGLQWEDIRKRSAKLLAQYGKEEDITRLVQLCNSPLTNGDVRRTVRSALVKAGYDDKIDWYATLTADFNELKSCKDRNQIIMQMIKTEDNRFVPFLKKLKPKKFKRRRKGLQKTENACIKVSVNKAIKALSKK